MRNEDPKRAQLKLSDSSAEAVCDNDRSNEEPHDSPAMADSLSSAESPSGPPCYSDPSVPQNNDLAAMVPPLPAYSDALAQSGSRDLSVSVINYSRSVKTSAQYS